MKEDSAYGPTLLDDATFTQLLEVASQDTRLPKQPFCRAMIELIQAVIAGSSPAGGPLSGTMVFIPDAASDREKQIAELEAVLAQLKAMPK